MQTYSNGRYPLRLFIHRGGNIYLTPSLNARWNEAVRLALEKYKVRLWITGDVDGLGGWNGYRPWDAQGAYKRYYGRFAAAQGHSSHGGRYQGREVFAVDVANWADLGWGRFKAIMRLVGLTVDFVFPQELWHVGDFSNPWVAPVFGRPAINPKTTRLVPEEEDDDMRPTVHVRTEGTAEWTLAHPDIGADLPQFTGTATDKNSRLSPDKSVKTFRGFMVTVDKGIGMAWARMYARGGGNETSRTNRAGYIDIQIEASRVAQELAA